MLIRRCGCRCLAAVSATGHTGKGYSRKCPLFSASTPRAVSRPLAVGCTAANIGAETKSTYSADYYFYKPGK